MPLLVTRSGVLCQLKGDAVVIVEVAQFLVAGAVGDDTGRTVTGGGINSTSTAVSRS